jgi:hypothetical protein
MSTTLTENIEKIEGFLKEKELVYTISENVITVPYEIGDLVFNPQIEFKGKWLTVSALVLPRASIPDSIVNELYYECLSSNHELPEITYEVDRDTGDIYVGCDMRIAITDFDNFFSEFISIPYGIKNFIDRIAPKFNLEVKGTGG